MTEQELVERIANDTAFLSLPREQQLQQIKEWTKEPLAPAVPREQPEVLNPSAAGMGRPYDPMSAENLAWSLAQGVGAGAGSAMGAQAIARGLQALPHPVPKIAGTALSAGSRLAGAAGGSAAVGATRAAVHQATGEPDKPIGEAATDAAIEGAVGEVIGSATLGAVRAVPKALTGPPVNPEVIAAAEKHGVQLTAAEQAEKKIPAIIQERLRSALPTAERLDEFSRERQQAFQKWAEDLAETYFGGVKSPLVGGGQLQQIISGESIPHYRAAARRHYEMLSDLPKVAPSAVKSILDRLQELDTAIGRTAAPAARGILEDIRSRIATQNPVSGAWIPRSLTFAEMHDVRSLLLQIGRAHTDALPDRVGGLASHIANTTIHDVLEQTARRAGPAAVDRWKRADKYVKLGHEIFDDAAIVGALRARPEDVINVTFTKRGITEAERTIAALKRSSNPTEAINIYRQTAMGRLLERATVDGKLDPTKIETAIYGANGVGEDTMRVVFGDEFVKEFKLFLGAVKKASFVSKRDVAGNPSGSANSMIQWVEGSYLLGLGGSALVDALKGTISPHTAAMAATAASYTIGTRGLIRLMTTPEGLRLLRKGLVTRPTSQEAIKLAPRIVAIVGIENLTAN